MQIDLNKWNTLSRCDLDTCMQSQNCIRYLLWKDRGGSRLNASYTLNGEFKCPWYISTTEHIEKAVD